MLISSSILLRHLVVMLSLLTPLFLSSPATHYHRILHQQFFPRHSLPPSQSPNSSPPAPAPPDYPFTPSVSSPPDNPFFPETSIPPPPPPPPSTALFASFPANISSLIIPRAPKSSKSASSKLIAGAIAAVVAAIILVSVSAFLHFRKRRRREFGDTKTHRSDNNTSGLHHTNSANSSNGVIPKLQRPSQLSSEFLYLGTLVSSHVPGIHNAPAESSSANDRRMGSPELRPLPPLNGRKLGRSYENAQLYSCREEEEDDDNEFYSPRRVRDDPIGTGSEQRNGFAAVEHGKFGGTCSCSSYSSSSSVSGSPIRSVSLSTSPPVSLSPERSRAKSPELVSIQLTPPPNPSSPPVLPSSSFSGDPLADQKEFPSLSQFPSQPPIHPVFIAPPPPPPLLNKQVEVPRNSTPQERGLVCDPLVLVTPVSPTAVESPALISPIQVPSYSKDVENNESIPDLKENYDDKVEKNGDNLKPKLKPLHWDEVRASSDRQMVWDQLKSSSFKFNEEMIETLFLVNAPKPPPKQGTGWPVLPLPNEAIRVLDPKKCQNIATLLTALNVTVDDVCEALVEGKWDNLRTELLENLLKLAPTKEEERKLKEHEDDSSVKLGPAEKFLKAVLEVPFAFRRMETMLYISHFESEVEYLKTSFETLEAACEELRNSRVFLKLLEAVLKTGNCMNVGTDCGDAHAFQLDTLLKLVDVKGADGKPTLLHFVVQEIIKREGAPICNAYQNNCTSVNDDANCHRLGLQVLSALSSDLMNVMKAAAMDSEVLNSDVLKLSNGLENIAEVISLVDNISNQKFSESMNGFMIVAEKEIIKIQAQESVALSVVKEITEYFHGNTAKEEAHPLRIFMVVRDFLMILDQVCKEVGSTNERTTVGSAREFPVPVNPTLQPTSSGFPARQLYISLDDEISSP